VYLNICRPSPKQSATVGVLRQWHSLTFLHSTLSNTLHVHTWLQVLSSAVEPASDVWAAGVMAYQLLSGRFPFDDWQHPDAPALSLVGTSQHLSWQGCVALAACMHLPATVASYVHDEVRYCVTVE
jgi:serine/threonine protein kinase